MNMGMSHLVPQSPLECILKNWNIFKLDELREKRLIFLCNNTWPRCKLEDGKLGQKREVLTVIPYYNGIRFAERKANGLRSPVYRPS